jgi:hypothetical protein
MTLTIELQPEIERSLLARASAKGLSLTAFAQEVLTREAWPEVPPVPLTGQALIDSAARVRGLFSDGEVDLLSSRTPSQSRPVDFS